MRVAWKSLKKKIQWNDEYYCHIDMSAFLAILLVLWILVSAWNQVGVCTLAYDRPAVNLFHANNATLHPKARREDAMTVTITHDGKVYFRDMQIAEGKLKDLVIEGTQEGAERRIYFNVDQRAQYGVVQDVLDIVQSAGITQITFTTNYGPA